MLTFGAVARRYRPRWIVWENVPGVLSSNKGRDFGTFLGMLAELGYGFAYRVLDAQYVRTCRYRGAVPQRRRRVFVVGYLGDWRRAAAVLFDRESLRGDPPPRREAGKGVANTISARPTGGGGLGTDFDCDGGLLAFGGNNTSGPIDVATACQAHGGPHGRQDFGSETFIASRDVAATLTRGAESSGKGGHAGRRQEDDENLVAHSLRGEGFDASEDGTGRGTPLVPFSFGGQMSVPQVDFNLAQTLQAKNPQAVAHPYTLAIRGRDGQPDLEYRQDGTANAVLTPNGGRAGIGVGAVAFTCSDQSNSFAWERDVYPTLDAQIPNDTSNIQKGIRQGLAVRRLTPRECERLQGFPDGFCNIPWRGKDHAPDGPRYKALGNSMAVNVMDWIGRRIVMVDGM